jgi:Holliday junction resolvase-like predicted endonuclease
MFGWLMRSARALLRWTRGGRAGREGLADRLGPKSELAARAFLERAGFSILAANYRCPMGELDLVAREGSREGNRLVFVEVKSRSGVEGKETQGRGEEEIDAARARGRDAAKENPGVPPFVAPSRRRGVSASSSRPERAVTRAKQKRIGRAARYYCKSHRCADAIVRFDVIAVEWPAGSADPTIRHHVAAFRPDV